MLNKLSKGMDIRIYIIVMYSFAIDRSSAVCRLSKYTDNDRYADILCNCSDNSLTEINKLPKFPENGSVALDLSYNKFHFINATTFSGLTGREKVTSLLLDHNNNISPILEYSFSAFPNLRRLDLASCSLRKENISKHAFLGLTKLEELSLLYNDFSAGYPSNQISHLRSLRKIHMDVFEGFEFDDNFTFFRKLREINFYPVGDFHLTNRSFHGLSKCPIRYIYFNFGQHVFCDMPEELLCFFPNLKGVKIDFRGRCNFTRALRVLKCVQNRTMDYIDASGNWPNDRTVYTPSLDDWALEYLSNICVKKLLLNHTTIMQYSFSHFGKTLLRCVNYLDLSRNEAGYTPKFIATLYQFRNIQFCNISRINDNLQLQTVPQRIPLLSFNLPSTLEVLDISNNQAGELDFQVNITAKASNLTQLYLRKTPFPCYTFNILDCPHLEILDISECYFKVLRPNFFRALKRMKILYAIKSMKNIKLDDVSSAKLFESQTRLLFLDLSENSLANLHISMFRFQRKSLKTLILDKNLFSFLPKAIGELQSLSVLSLKDNKFKTISQADIDILRRLDNVRMDVAGNIMTCSCSAEDDLYRIKVNKYLFTSQEEVSCFEFDIRLSQLLLDDKWRKYQMTCISPFWLKCSVTIVLLSIFVLISVAGIYRNRVIVDYFILRFRLFMRRQKYDINCDEYNYEVFISYSNADYVWVTSTLYNKLIEYGFRVCLHHKDFIPGNSISEEIVRCIDESRKVLLVVTEDFLNSSWTSYEVQMAQQHAFRKNREAMIIIVMKDDIPIARMPRELRNFWWKIVCARWPQEDSEREIITFWEALKSSIEQ